MQIKHYVVYVARLIEKVCSGNTYCGWGRRGGGATTPLQGVTSCQLLGNHCKIYSDIV